MSEMLSAPLLGCALRKDIADFSDISREWLLDVVNGGFGGFVEVEGISEDSPETERGEDV
ncbi:unnamed protein product [Anisakis simplex]|uniref:Uncharacterized protein n=1 Tax=Anisakis simplex TaxID=6269 RepID=A0A3P6SFX0_ANISI|nr:unnamed protein product [Anisakis simplex]